MRIKRKEGLLILGVILLVFMFVMFSFSNTPYKEQDMRPFLEKIIHLNENSLPDIEFFYGGSLVTSKMPYDFIEFFIRKASHVTEYALLAFLAGVFVRFARPRLRVAAYFASFFFSFFYACLDEWHQSFIQGRTGHIIDVITFDSFGILIGLCLCHAVTKRIFS
ncbi:VanZ family protein [Heyndrickxia acidiproducens]|uniref:VanZ family protein n=1 Tax=Heyndrickxia acidiproducens TaxID=1121084 RepID=UPI00035F13E5|nr:VanZ family protein [Heyndrickxia acidiproducens]